MGQELWAWLDPEVGHTLFLIMDEVVISNRRGLTQKLITPFLINEWAWFLMRWAMRRSYLWAWLEPEAGHTLF